MNVFWCERDRTTANEQRENDKTRHGNLFVAIFVCSRGVANEQMAALYSALPNVYVCERRSCCASACTQTEDTMDGSESRYLCVRVFVVRWEKSAVPCEHDGLIEDELYCFGRSGA